MISEDVVIECDVQVTNVISSSLDILKCIFGSQSFTVAGDVRDFDTTCYHPVPHENGGVILQAVRILTAQSLGLEQSQQVLAPSTVAER